MGGTNRDEEVEEKNLKPQSSGRDGERTRRDYFFSFLGVLGGLAVNRRVNRVGEVYLSRAEPQGRRK